MKSILEAALWISALALGLHTALLLIGELHASIEVADGVWAPLRYEPPPRATPGKADALRTLERRSPFTFAPANQEAAELPEQVLSLAPPVPSQPFPPMLLAGVSRGPTWRALIEGVPGVAGAVSAQVGDSIAGMFVQTIDWNTVALISADSILILQINSQWR